MMIGETVLFDDGSGEGTLISVIGHDALISTKTGPIQRPIKTIKPAPVQVITLDDTVGVEEEIAIVQRSAAPVDDGNRVEHAAEAEAEIQAIAEEAPVRETAEQEAVLESLPEALQEGGLLDDFNAPQTTVEPPAEAQPAPTGLPQRFGKRWLTDQTTETLRELMVRSDIPKARLAKVQEELDRREGGGGS